MKLNLLIVLVLTTPAWAFAHVYVCEVAPSEVAYISFTDQNHFSLIDSGHSRTGDYSFKSSLTLPKYGPVDYYIGAKPPFYLKAGMNDMAHPIESGFIISQPGLKSYFCSLAR
jgi:hypothetical protein